MISKHAAVKQLMRLKSRRLDAAKSVRRKKAISPAEKAMWLVDLDHDAQALDLAIQALNEAKET